MSGDCRMAVTFFIPIRWAMDIFGITVSIGDDKAAPVILM